MELPASSPTSALALHRRIARLRSAVPYAALAVLLIACSVLLGWALGNKPLQRILPGLTTMKVNTALELLLLAAALYGAHRESGWWRWLVWICVLAVIVLGGLTLMEYAFGVDLRIDNFLFVDRDPIRYPGRNAPATILCFFIVGVGFLLLLEKHWITATQIVLTLAMLAPLATLGGYLYGAPSMYVNVPYPVIALNTAVAIMALCLGGLLLRGGDGLMRVVSSQSSAGTIARRLLPLAFVLPAAAGVLTLAGERAGLYSRAWSAAMLVSFCALLFAGSVWWTATLLNRTEEIAHDYANRFREVADTMPLIVWTARPDGAIDFYNRRWSELTGLRPGQIGDEFWKAIMHPDDLQPCVEAWKAALQSQTPFQCEYRFFHPGENRHRWFLARALPVRAVDGNIVRWYGTCTDIDDQKRAEQAAQSAMREAETANKAKDQFLAVLSHELRTPLTPVLLAVSLLQMQPQFPPECTEELDMIRRQVELEAHLIDDLLDLTRIVRGRIRLNLEITDAHVLLQRAIQTCCGDRMSDLKLSLNAAEHHIHADPARVQQIFWNTLSNAVKFTSPGKPIAISTSNEGQQLCIEVKDWGEGIEASALARIFNAFEQADSSLTRRYGGLGLGLTIAKALVDAHGGTIQGRSEGKDKGSTFTIAFPVVPADLPQSRPRLPHRSVSGLRILLVEDHRETLEVMQRLLRELGHQVRMASTMHDAQELANSEPIDLLISDLALPDGSGHDLMRSLRASYAIKGIAVSGFGMENNIRDSLEAGFSQHLTKPISLDRLRAAIEQITREVSPHRPAQAPKDAAIDQGE